MTTLLHYLDTTAPDKCLDATGVLAPSQVPNNEFSGLIEWTLFVAEEIYVTGYIMKMTSKY